MRSLLVRHMFDERYPILSAWILARDGWIELGPDDFSRPMVRLLDIGGMIWESEHDCSTIDAALYDAEQALAAWIEENG